MRIGERVLPRGIILATALAAVALAGCPRVPETQPPPTPIAASGEPKPQLARPAEAQKPTPSPVEKPQTIAEKTREQVLNTWFQLLSSQQQAPENASYPDGEFLKIEIANGDLWKKYVPEILKTNSHPTGTPMEVRLIYIYRFFRDSKAAAGRKYISELQINNIKATGEMVQRQLTDADRANGIRDLWEGSGSISFIRSYRTISYAIGWNNPELLAKWLSQPPSDSFPPFSPWEQEEWTLGLRFINGQWQKQFFTKNDKFVLPSRVIFRCPNPSACKQVDLNEVKP